MNAVPFTVSVPEPVLTDLRDRLARTRWPDEIPGAGWDYGVSLTYLKELAEYWRTGFDWRVHESRLNELSNVSLDIDGLRMHAIHQRGRGRRPLPLAHHPRLAEHLLRGDRPHHPADRPRTPCARLPSVRRARLRHRSQHPQRDVPGLPGPRHRPAMRPRPACPAGLLR